MNTRNAVRAPEISPVYPYTPFGDDEIEQSIPERFEKQVRMHGHRLAIMKKRVK